VSDPLSDDQRKDLYMALLQGIANECQDRLCAADQQHAWGKWTRYEVQQDGPIPFATAGEFMDRVVHVRSERKCLNCGKEQHA
jgi:hypothetical protein